MADKLSVIKVWHKCGYNTEQMLEQLEAFIADPAHAEYTYLSHQINYICPTQPQSQLNPRHHYWVEITMLYKE